MHSFFLMATFLAASPETPEIINTETLKLDLKAFKEKRTSYLVYGEDPSGERTGPVGIWDRSLKLTKGDLGKSQYAFEWKMFRADKPTALISATGTLPSLAPLTHRADYFGARPSVSLEFQKGVAIVPRADQKTESDKTFQVKVDPRALIFPWI
jgi:hypothetical protein